MAICVAVITKSPASFACVVRKSQEAAEGLWLSTPTLGPIPILMPGQLRNTEKDFSLQTCASSVEKVFEAMAEHTGEQASMRSCNGPLPQCVITENDKAYNELNTF